MDAVGDVLICNIPLKDHQRRTLQAEGLELGETDDPTLITDPEFLLIRDDLYFSASALQRFLAVSAKQPGSSGCALEAGPFTEFTKFLQDLRTEQDASSGAELVAYGMYRCRGQLPSTGDLKTIPLARIEAKQTARPIEPGTVLPISMSPSFTPAFSDATLLHVCHWANLWLLNLVVLMDTLRSTFLGNRFSVILRALSALSLDKQKIAQRFVVKGKGCQIHPTAVVQASILGDGVKIGAYSVVRGSILGDGVHISDQSIVTGTIFGANSFDSPNGLARMCVVYPGTQAGKIQGTVVGRNVFMALVCRLLDVKFEGSVKVLHKGRIEDTGMNFLGVCVGHNARIGADVWVVPGREIPNGMSIVKDPRDMISVFPPDLPEGEIVCLRDGKLVPVRST